mmetsp:Transcript_32215/g.80818  ORF Transcript_32215/g.80818 Transcript_32215/m.80818 type:complete len:431 (-) Transcript_32215:22-1314(-)
MEMLCSALHNVGLSDCVPAFLRHDVDIATFVLMQRDDLVEIGIPSSALRMLRSMRQALLKGKNAKDSLEAFVKRNSMSLYVSSDGKVRETFSNRSSEGVLTVIPLEQLVLKGKRSILAFLPLICRESKIENSVMFLLDECVYAKLKESKRLKMASRMVAQYLEQNSARPILGLGKISRDAISAVCMAPLASESLPSSLFQNIKTRICQLLEGSPVSRFISSGLCWHVVRMMDEELPYTPELDSLSGGLPALYALTKECSSHGTMDDLFLYMDVMWSRHDVSQGVRNAVLNRLAGLASTEDIDTKFSKAQKKLADIRIKTTDILEFGEGTPTTTPKQSRRKSSYAEEPKKLRQRASTTSIIPMPESKRGWRSIFSLRSSTKSNPRPKSPMEGTLGNSLDLSLSGSMSESSGGITPSTSFPEIAKKTKSTRN